MAYNIITEINGVKHYIRRLRISKYCITPTMLTVAQTKAYDFKTLEKATGMLSKMGIGYAIEPNN